MKCINLIVLAAFFEVTVTRVEDIQIIISLFRDRSVCICDASFINSGVGNV